MRREPFVIVHGRLERRDGTVNVTAQRITLLSVPEEIAPAAHNFG